jgi:hypothetical protein
MRLTIRLDEDVYALARSLAKAEDITIAAAVNRLVRKGVTARPAAESRPKRRHGLLVSAGRVPVTAETVRRIDLVDDGG